MTLRIFHRNFFLKSRFKRLHIYQTTDRLLFSSITYILVQHVYCLDTTTQDR